MILLDTSILVDNLRDTPLAGAAIDAAVARREVVLASVLSFVEIVQGMRSRERGRAAALADSLGWIEVSLEIADRAGEHARRFRRSHPGIGTVDFVIGATAEVLGAELWTTNVRHFPMFPELVPPY